MGLQHYTQDKSKIPLKYHINVMFCTKYTHPMLICRGADARTHRHTENIYSIIRDKLLLLGEHGKHTPTMAAAIALPQQSANMISDKSMLLKVEDIIGFAIY